MSSVLRILQIKSKFNFGESYSFTKILKQALLAAILVLHTKSITVTKKRTLQKTLRDYRAILLFLSLRLQPN